MFNFLKKKRKPNTVVENTVVENKAESIFPDANELLETTQKKWRHVTAEEVLEAMQKEAQKGNRYIKIFDSYISDELVSELKAKGYKVEITLPTSSMGPYFKISW